MYNYNNNYSIEKQLHKDLPSSSVWLILCCPCIPDNGHSTSTIINNTDDIFILIKMLLIVIILYDSNTKYSPIHNVYSTQSYYKINVCEHNNNFSDDIKSKFII